MTNIKFGTDGWRAIIAKDFTVENVTRVAEATALWLKSQHPKASVIVGHDCRFAGELFAETVAAPAGRLFGDLHPSWTPAGALFNAYSPRFGVGGAAVAAGSRSGGGRGANGHHLPPLGGFDGA